MREGAPPTQCELPPVDATHPLGRLVRECVRWRPLSSLWDLQGVPIPHLACRIWKAAWEDDLFGSAAELGYWFLFALFPTLVSASAMIGLAARHGAQNYDRLLRFAALLLPPSAYGFIYQTFNEITTASNGKKLTFGLVVALWAASAGFSAIQDAMNTVYRIRETRPYWKVRGAAVLIGTLLSLLITAILAVLLATSFFARLTLLHVAHRALAHSAALLVRATGWLAAIALLALLFALIYYWAPDLKQRRWRWLSPGAAIGIVGWLLASAGLRAYLHFFNTYTETYGSLGAVIVLLTWLYLSGFMLLLGGEVNGEIEAAATERRLRAQDAIAP